MQVGSTTQTPELYLLRECIKRCSSIKDLAIASAVCKTWRELALTITFKDSPHLKKDAFKYLRKIYLCKPILTSRKFPLVLKTISTKEISTLVGTLWGEVFSDHRASFPFPYRMNTKLQNGPRHFLKRISEDEVKIVENTFAVKRWEFIFPGDPGKHSFLRQDPDFPNEITFIAANGKWGTSSRVHQKNKKMLIVHNLLDSINFLQKSNFIECKIRRIDLAWKTLHVALRDPEKIYKGTVGVEWSRDKLGNFDLSVAKVDITTKKMDYKLLKKLGNFKFYATPYDVKIVNKGKAIASIDFQNADRIYLYSDKIYISRKLEMGKLFPISSLGLENELAFELSKLCVNDLICVADKSYKSLNFYDAELNQIDRLNFPFSIRGNLSYLDSWLVITNINKLYVYHSKEPHHPFQHYFSETINAPEIQIKQLNKKFLILSIPNSNRYKVFNLEQKKELFSFSGGSKKQKSLLWKNRLVLSNPFSPKIEIIKLKTRQQMSIPLKKFLKDPYLKELNVVDLGTIEHNNELLLGIKLSSVHPFSKKKSIETVFISAQKKCSGLYPQIGTMDEKL